MWPPPNLVCPRPTSQRGGWDARLESLVVHAVVRGEADDTLASRAAELGWEDVTSVSVIAPQVAMPSGRWTGPGASCGSGGFAPELSAAPEEWCPDGCWPEPGFLRSGVMPSTLSAPPGAVGVPEAASGCGVRWR